jgi:hypothetical protein
MKEKDMPYQLPTTSPLGQHQSALKASESATSRATASFGDLLHIEPDKYGGIELRDRNEGDGCSRIRLDADQMAWVVQQFIRLLGITL